MKITTRRGFSIVEFEDNNGEACSIQKSSLATEDCIWLGLDSADPQIMANDAHRLNILTSSNNGWAKFEIPKEVLLKTRMHLTRKQVAKLLPLLQRFVDTGEIQEI